MNYGFELNHFDRASRLQFLGRVSQIWQAAAREAKLPLQVFIGVEDRADTVFAYFRGVQNNEKFQLMRLKLLTDSAAPQFSLLVWSRQGQLKEIAFNDVAGAVSATAEIWLQVARQPPAALNPVVPSQPRGEFYQAATQKPAASDITKKAQAIVLDIFTEAALPADNAQQLSRENLARVRRLLLRPKAEM